MGVVGNLDLGLSLGGRRRSGLVARSRRRKEAASGGRRTAAAAVDRRNSLCSPHQWYQGKRLEVLNGLLHHERFGLLGAIKVEEGNTSLYCTAKP